jgi:hypothetical protein
MGRENYESNRKYHDLSKAEKERLNRAAGRRERTNEQKEERTTKVSIVDFDLSGKKLQ